MINSKRERALLKVGGLIRKYSLSVMANVIIDVNNHTFTSNDPKKAIIQPVFLDAVFIESNILKGRDYAREEGLHSSKC